jgi:hypothetical protein
MAQYEELTIDKGTDVTLQLELEDTNGNAKKSYKSHGCR